MNWAVWLFVGIAVGTFAGVLVMALMIMARDPGPPANPNGDEGSAS